MGMEIPGIIQTIGTPEGNKKQPRRKTGVAKKITAIVTQKQKQATEINLDEAIKALENTCSFFNKRLKLMVNRRIDRVIVKVIDRKTDKVIKEIPSEEIQNMVARIRETIGLLIDEKI